MFLPIIPGAGQISYLSISFARDFSRVSCHVERPHVSFAKVADVGGTKESANF